VLYRTVQLQPGPFQFQNLNLPGGSNVTQIVLHDAFGNVTQFGSVFYGAQEILRKGVSDYSYHVGFARLSPFAANDSYGPLSAVGSYRLGFTDAVTAGADVEASQGIVDGGPTFSARLPIGQLDVAATFSNARGIRGQAESAAYSFVSGRISASAAAQLRSDDFATIALPVTTDRRTVATAESFGYRFSRFVDLNLSHTGAHNRDSGPADQLTGELNLRTANGAGWTISLERDRGSFFALNGTASARNTWTAGIALALGIGRSGYLQAQTTDVAGQTSTTISYDRSAQDSPGQIAYDASAQLGQGQDSLLEDALYHANNFDAKEELTTAQGGSSALVGLSGGVAFFKQGVFFTRPLRSSYGLVHVAGLSGLPISLGGITQGTIDKRGYIVVPDMTPYIDNRVQVGGLETMPDFQADAGEKRVVPRDESGGAVDFSVNKIQLFVGMVVVRKGTSLIPPRYGVLQVFGPGGTSVSDIGENGEFFFESLQPGKYRGTITYDDNNACSFDLLVPSTSDFRVDLGVQTCVER
jgi:outer membrane usher protein